MHRPREIRTDVLLALEGSGAGSPRSTHVESFGEDGLLKESRGLDEHGRVLQRSVWSYEDGKLLAVHDYGFGRRLNRTVTFAYRERGRVLSESAIDGLGNVIYRKEWHYEASGATITEFWESPNPAIIELGGVVFEVPEMREARWHLDDFGSVREVLFLGSDKADLGRIDAVYDDQERLIATKRFLSSVVAPGLTESGVAVWEQSVRYDADGRKTEELDLGLGQPLSRREFVYEEHGLISQELIWYASEALIARVKFDYEFNECDDWIEQEVRRWDEASKAFELVSKTTRQITYY